jgi:hypothetical protein
VGRADIVATFHLLLPGRSKVQFTALQYGAFALWKNWSATYQVGGKKLLSIELTDSTLVGEIKS